MMDQATAIAGIQNALAKVTGFGGTAPPPPSSAMLSIALDFGGNSVARFNQNTAVDRGEFVGEFVRQQSFLATDPAFPDWRVWFRPDSDGTRDEVVVEYGRTTHGTFPVKGYTATITSRGSVVYTANVPQHFGYARWRWQSRERAVVRTPAALKARKWLPNFGTIGLYGKPASTNKTAWRGPFDIPPGFDPFMGSTGGNHQIGPITTYAAEYLLYGTANALLSMRTEGEWCGNWCTHLRDDVTGAPLDVRGQKLSMKDNGGTINSYPLLTITANPASVIVDSAHRYSCPNVIWMLTDDPYLLEELQFGVNRHLLDASYHRFANNLHGMMQPNQTRAYAWGLRDLFMVTRTTPASVPSWLLPQSYWQACLDDNKTYAMKFVNSTARVHALFRTWTRTDLDSAWQSAYLNTAVGMGVSMGFADWLPIFKWCVDKHIQQTNGTSGWPRQWPVPYYSIPDKASVYNIPTGLLGVGSDATVCTSWSDYWNYYKSGSPDAAGVKHSDVNGSTVNDAGWDPITIKQNPTSAAYFLQLRTALALAVTHGVAGAVASYAYLDERLRNQLLPQYGNAFGLAQFSIDP